MRHVLVLLALIALPAAAQEQVYRLSEADKQAAIDAASRAPEQQTRLPVISGRAPDAADRRPHGEVSIMVGTGGSRAIAGSIGVPLGENGGAQLGFGSGRFPGQFLGQFPGQFSGSPLLGVPFDRHSLRSPFGGALAGPGCIDFTSPYCR